MATAWKQRPTSSRSSSANSAPKCGNSCLVRQCLTLLFCATGCALLFAAEPATVITGDQMEIRRGGNVVIFTGNSLVSRGDSRLSADVLTQDKKNNRVEAAGNVAFRTYNRAQELLAGTAGRGWYDLSARTGALWTGRPLVAYHMKSSTGPLTLEAERIEFNETTEEVTATGAVEIVSSSMTARAPQARFFQQARKVILTNGAQQPELIYRGADGPGHYQADTITVFVDRRRIIMEGNARGRMVVQTDDAHKAETNAAGKQKP